MGLLENASVAYIDDIPRWHIDYEYFVQAHMLKKNKEGKLVMMYMDYTNEVPLPSRNLGLYAVNSFVFDLQVKEAAPRRSASARLARNPQPRYHGDDLIPEGPAFTSYAGFDQARPSQVYQPEYAGWEQPSPCHSESSLQRGSSRQWQHGNFDYYQQQPFGEISSGRQGGRMSFSARGYHDQPMGYHDQQMEYACLDNRLTVIEETQHNIQDTLHQQSQWQEEVGQRLTNIQQHQQQEDNNWHYLFDNLHIDPPFWSIDCSITQLGGGAPNYRGKFFILF